MRSILHQAGLQETNRDGWALSFSGHGVPSRIDGPWQKTNHFPGVVNITNKAKMQDAIRQMQRVHGMRHFDFIPRTFHLPSEWQEFSRVFAAAGPHVWWISKPVNSSRGRGISIITRPEEVPLDECVVSHYISDPLLAIDGLKFDMRIYVAVTSIHPLRLYVHEEGLARFATRRFSLDRPDDLFTHLTNYSINKDSPTFVPPAEGLESTEGEEGAGSKWSLAALKRRLARCRVPVDRIFAEIDQMIVKAVIAAEARITQATRTGVPHPLTNCFELFGFDVMIDSHHNPWLLEVNLSPSLATESPLDLRIKSTVVADLLNLAGIRIPPYRYNESSRSAYGTSKAAVEAEEAIAESADEFLRAAETGFRRLYPVPGCSALDGLFDGPRPLNVAVRERLINPSPVSRFLPKFGPSPSSSLATPGKAFRAASAASVLGGAAASLGQRGLYSGVVGASLASAPQLASSTLSSGELPALSLSASFAPPGSPSTANEQRRRELSRARARSADLRSSSRLALIRTTDLPSAAAIATNAVDLSSSASSIPALSSARDLRVVFTQLLKSLSARFGTRGCTDEAEGRAVLAFASAAQGARARGFWWHGQQHRALVGPEGEAILSAPASEIAITPQRLTRKLDALSALCDRAVLMDSRRSAGAARGAMQRKVELGLWARLATEDQLVEALSSAVSPKAGSMAGHSTAKLLIAAALSAGDGPETPQKSRVQAAIQVS